MAPSPSSFPLPPLILTAQPSDLLALQGQDTPSSSAHA
jgi:hypothetical protein